jgi:hypothetical protein
MCVVVDKRERKLAGLLVEGSASVKCQSNWNELVRLRCRLKKLREEKPEVYACLLSKYFGVLDEIKRSLEGEVKSGKRVVS